MSIFYVKKDGSGTHSQIQSAIYDAQDGDVVDIGLGLWEENVELYKSITLQGAGKTQTTVKGKYVADSFPGCSFYAGTNIVNVTDASAMIRGRRISGTNIAANTRIDSILSNTQIRLSLNTSSTGVVTKIVASLTSGSSTVVLPNVTGVTVNSKVEGLGVDALVTVVNSTTKTITLSSPLTQSGSNVTLTFRPLRSNVTLTLPTLFAGSVFGASIQVTNAITNGLTVKNIKVMGYDSPNPAIEVSAFSMSSPSSGSHENWLIDNCEFTADGDYAFVTGSNFKSINGVVQNCVFNGKTFSGDEPADVASISSSQFTINNVPRQLVVIGNSSTVSNCLNTSFKNNIISGFTGALIASSGNSNVFNSAVTIDTIGGLIENNTFNGSYGIGYALRTRRPSDAVVETIVRDNVIDMTIGQNSGYSISGGSVTQSNNTTMGVSYLVTPSQPIAGQPVVVEMNKTLLKMISKVSADPIFSNETNWELVSFIYKKQGSSKRLVSSFRNFEEEKSMRLRSGMMTGDVFQLHKIIISKADRTLLVIKRSEINGVSSYDFTLA